MPKKRCKPCQRSKRANRNVLSQNWRIRSKSDEDQTWIESLLSERWGSSEVVVHGSRLDASSLEALVVDGRHGLATYRINERAELIALDTVMTGRGLGSALIRELANRLRNNGSRKLWGTTTNDNIDARRFYQRRGFCLRSVRPRAVDQARRVKPSIPVIGNYGIPIRDEIDLAKKLDDGL